MGFQSRNFLPAVVVASMLFVAITSLGISVAVLPPYINKVLGLPGSYVGLIVVMESVATLLSRPYAGRFSDRHGPKRAMVTGLLLLFAAGTICFILTDQSVLSAMPVFALVCFSRLLMGVGESLVFTSSGTWPIGLIGREHAGKVMSWVGIGMFLGLAIGNYIGAYLFRENSVLLSMLIMSCLPFFGVMVVLFVEDAKVPGEPMSISTWTAIRKIWRPGSGFALGNVGYASITSFLLLFLMEKGWQTDAPMILSLFGVGYVVARLMLGKKADAYGLKAVWISLIVESLGLLLVANAPQVDVVMLGAFMTGLGLSMVYPLLALPAIKSLPDTNIGLALSTYEACFDIGILLAGGVGGLCVSHFGYASVFYFASGCAVVAMFSSWLAYRELQRASVEVNLIKLQS
ncbi:MFS transporter [Pseudomonas sp. P9_31]|uniref:MFS transporter n=1 Tax=Pseudomonas sp. P9_31 TaxID=3043448 RepID=UPI002A35877E|nr:MFS transporter [Pseudomonas sp. P9_31]WPN60556.1 MFS transporter [Pseudomonas sp. P9_31]